MVKMEAETKPVKGEPTFGLSVTIQRLADVNSTDKVTSVSAGGRGDHGLVSICALVDGQVVSVMRHLVDTPQDEFNSQLLAWDEHVAETYGFHPAPVLIALSHESDFTDAD